MCLPAGLYATCGAVPCSPGANNACSVSCVTVSVPNATVLYYGDTPITTGTATPETIDFGILQSGQDAVKTFEMTAGTFSAASGVTVSARDDSGKSDFTLLNKDAPDQTIGFNLQYVDCSSTVPHPLAYGTPLSLTAGQSAMVAITDFPNGTAPCHPYQGNPTAGNGAGQLIFTIPAANMTRAAGGDYTDQVTLTIQAVD